MGILEQLVDSARTRVERRRQELSEGDLESRLKSGRSMAGVRSRHGFRAALRASGLSVISEFKRRSPSAGSIADHGLEDRVKAYERGGARAVSVLTDSDHFGGSLEDLELARRITELPLLRKDFIVERYQLLEALDAGADAALLIVRALDDDSLAELISAGAELGLDCLVEAHTAGEIERALKAGAEIVGINNRDLDTGRVDIETTFELIELLPEGVTSIGESGFDQPEQLRRLEDTGVDAVLIGESVMRVDDAEAELRRLRSRI